MKHLLIIAVAVALAAAKPEMYRENEDFQYSRSSSDDGTKAGYYGAQRGNMGGNYERAHNMDSLAQNQMSGLVRQTEGELGDGSNTRTGSVYSAANSRGIYGSGRYDLTNLEGRNFQESESRGNSQSHSSLSSQNSGYSGQSSSALHSSGYNSNQGRDSRYQATKNLGHTSHASNLQTAQSAHAADAYDYNRQTGYNSGYQSQSGYRSGYTNQHSSDVYGSNPRTRLVGGAPARVVIRPGTTVIVPIAAQTYDSGHSASAFDQNAINTDAEVLSNTNRDTSFRSASNPKHYESSYNYRKEWEKHDTHTAPSAVPLAVPTENPFPGNSELYDDNQASRTSDTRGTDYQNAHSGYHSNVKSAASSQSRHQSDYNSQHSSLSSGSNSNAFTQGAYNSGASADTTNVLGDVNTNKPKSYQSAYSYHKSWERQGDPYVIYPDTNNVNDGQASQRLTDASTNQQYYSSHQYGSNYKHGHQHQSYGSADDCDENGHRRVARSYNQNQEIDPYQQSQTYEDQENLGQQEQNGWGNFQHSQNLEDLGQRNQNVEDLGQRSQNLEYLGQQTQNLQDLRQYSQNLEDFGQQSQNKWDRLEVGGPQSQKKWDNLEELGQQTQTDLGQHTQDTWNKATNTEKNEKLEDLAQQSQNQWENSEDLGQQVQNPWTTRQEQKHQNRSYNDKENTFKKQITESNLDNLHSFNQQSQISQKENVNTYQTHHYNLWHRVDGFESQNADQNNDQGISNNNQESQSASGGENFDQQINWHPAFQNEEKLGMSSQDSFSKLDTLNQDKRINIIDEMKPGWEQDDDDNTQKVSQNTDSDIFNDTYGTGYGYFREQNVGNSNQQAETTIGNHNWNTNDMQNARHEQELVTNTQNISHSNSGGRSSLQSLWNKINNFEQVTSTNNDKNENGSYFWHGYKNSQNSNQDRWRQTSDSNSNFNQSLRQHNNFGSGYGENQPPQSTLFNEIKSTSSTVKPEPEEALTHNVEKLRPQDVGRGDIGPYDTSVPVIISTEKSDIDENKPNSLIFTLNSNDKKYKTPEQIDALSLTKEMNKTTNDEEVTNEKQNIQQSDKTLSVLSLNQQKWLEEQRQHGSNERNSVHLSNNKTYLSNNANEKNESQRFNKHIESESTFHSIEPDNNNVDHKPITPVSVSQYKPNDKINHTQTNVKFEQGPEEIEQQNMEQQFVNLGQLGQQSENLGQHSQTAWSQNLDDFRQQEQTVWRPYEELHQSNTQQTENLGRSNQNQFQTSDFYNQRYQPIQNAEQQSQKIEDLQTAPEISQKVEDIQSVPQKNTDFEIVSPPEVSTEKPGFWKSVGSKLTNAKDKVSSWFRN